MIEFINAELKKYEPNINLTNYKVEKNGYEFTYYDYVLYVDDVRTDLGYTVVTKENKILSITDHTKGLDITKKIKNIKDLVSRKKLSTKRINEIAINTFNNTEEDNKGLKLTKHENKFYYDTDKDQLYLITMIKSETNEGQKSILDIYDKL